MGMGTLTRTQPLPGNDEHDPTSPRPAAKQTAAAARSLHKFPEPSPQTPARDPPTSPTTPPPAHTHLQISQRPRTHADARARATCCKSNVPTVETHTQVTYTLLRSCHYVTHKHKHTHTQFCPSSVGRGSRSYNTHTHTPLPPMKHPEAHPPTTRDCRAPHALP